MAFDPSQFGATPVAQPQASGFNPSSFGATPVAATAPPSSTSPDLLDKAADVATSVFPGTKQIGDSLGTIAAAGKAFFTGHPDIAANILKSQVSVPKLIGAYTAAGATAAGAALPGAESAAGSAAQLAGLGAASGAGETLADGGDPKAAAINAFKMGLAGAAVGGGAALAGKAIGSVLTKVPEHLYSNALKVTQRLQLAGKNPSSFLLDRGLWGTTGHLYAAAQQGIDEANQQIASKLSGDVSTLSTSDILSKVQQALESKFGEAVGPANIEATIKSLPIDALTKNETVSVAQANTLRQQLDKLLGDRFFLSQGSTNSIGRQALGEVANTLRATVQNASGTHDEFATLSKFITTKKLLDTAIARADKSFGIGFKDIGFGLGGYLAGGPVGAAATYAGEKAARSTIGQTGMAVALSKLRDMPTDSLGRISREAAVRLFAGLSDNGGQPQ